MTEAVSPDLKIEPFGSHHNRAGFACGVESLDRYFKIQANQDVKRKINGVFVVFDPLEPAEVLGYYTLCASALTQGDVPVSVRKHIPRYPLVSATLLGRLAKAIEPNPENLSIKITYTDDVIIDADFKDLVDKGIMQPLKNPAVFKQVSIDNKGRSIVWQEQNIDFCADGLRLQHLP